MQKYDADSRITALVYKELGVEPRGNCCTAKCVTGEASYKIGPEHSDTYTMS